VRAANADAGNSQYGYGPTNPSTAITLYYENEPGRTQPLTLPPGHYRCRFLVTEESFHNPVNSTPEGGYWKTVLASEDFIYDKKGEIVSRDEDPSNDVVFAISSNPSVTAMQARIAVDITEPSRRKYRATAQVLVTDAIGRPIRGATVKGFWSGAHTTKEVSATTNSTGISGSGPRSDGVAQFTTPEMKSKRGRCFRFIVTDVSKTGRSWNKLLRPGAQGCV
jgi:hypothetical protein